MRRQPEDMGLPVDGWPDPDDSDGRAPEPYHDEGHQWTSREALRNPTFWVLAFVFSMVMFSIGTVGIHRIPAFVERGMDPTWVAWALTLDAVLAGLATLVFGLYGGHLPVRFLGATGLLLMAISSVILIFGDTVLAMFASMSVFGFGIGGMMYMQNVIWADYFGRLHLGSIRGIVNPITMVVGGLGAPIAGYVFDSTGSYDNMWWLSIVLLVGAALAVSLTPEPRRPHN